MQLKYSLNKILFLCPVKVNCNKTACLAYSVRNLETIQSQVLAMVILGTNCGVCTYKMDVIVIGVFIDLWLESFHISQASKMG